MKEILLVCTGNLCRSPMAQAYLDKCLAERELKGQWQAVSAGTHARVGEGATQEANLLCEERGFPIRLHQAQLLTRERILAAETILVMEQVQRDIVLLLLPSAKAKVHLLSHFINGKGRGRDIPDPFMQPPKVYEEALAMIQRGVDGFLDTLSGR